MQVDHKNKVYKYKRYMRDGTLEERTGVVRDKKAKKNVQDKR